ncbi:MAG: UDP-glucose 4-epimerase GalE [Candidatus Cloacimonetes bacterium]|nr:UDP-glucose 4-epimerase GalE [Candidatus Cloacimonadota bacterium]
MKILITGGAGYIGSHTCVELLNKNNELIIVDNLSNSKYEAIKRIKQISGKEVKFYHTDILNEIEMDIIFQENNIEAVIHFAGSKAVGESCQIPLEYYKNNVTGSIKLFQMMQKHNVKKLVFSSSATVYGLNDNVPFKEEFPLSATNPYGRTKLMIEEILRDLYSSDNFWQISLLRYFNPVGAHPSGLLGEDPQGIPNNLMPFISQVAVGKLEKLRIFGNDYPTKDGTGVRDYIHVVDLAKGHLKALEKLREGHGCQPYNLGSGEGNSVLEVIQAFEEASNKKIPYEIVERRAGDIATSFADPSKANSKLEWKTKKTLLEMCADSWNWQRKNPKRY